MIQNPFADLLAEKKRSSTTDNPNSKRQKVDSIPKKQQSVEEKAIKHYSTPCCAQKCLWNFTLCRCVDCHMFYSKKTQAESCLWLKEKLTAVQGEKTKKTVSLLVDNVAVCNAAFK